MVSENGGWISVDEGRQPVSTPMEQKWVLVFAPDENWGPGGHVHVGLFYEFSGWKLQGSNTTYRVTHWQPLPANPHPTGE